MNTALFPIADHPIATRDEGLRRLAAFVPRSGRAYAAERNHDRGPDERSNVSVLSPYVRHRAITETEILRAVLVRYSLSSAEKFVQEVFWRTYWKGWLEAHPAAWSRYRQTLAERFADCERDAQLSARYEAAMAGRSGIDAFDAWATELRERNYLHNHARMWFASIWIFTLGLPWELGADFFFRHLLDGDPASNTLSWRWVAGLQTRGKAYTATRDNIAHYTGARFAAEPPLARAITPLDDAPLALVPLPVVSSATELAVEPSLLVLHEDDLHGDLTELPSAATTSGVCALRASHRRSARDVSPAVSAFSDALAAQAVTRVAVELDAPDLGVLPAGAGELQAVRAAALSCGATRIVTPFAPVGPVRETLDEIRAAAVVPLYAEFGRRYDAVAWPAATRGFFALRTRIAGILDELGIAAG